MRLGSGRMLITSQRQWDREDCWIGGAEMDSSSIKLICDHRVVRTEQWADLGVVVAVLFHRGGQTTGAIHGNWPKVVID